MNRNLFDFKPSAWLPTQDKAVLEYCRNIKREEMETTNENGYSIRVVPHPSSAVACELFDWIYRSDVEDKKTVIVEIFTIKGIPSASYEHFRLKALDSTAVYMDRMTGKRYSGEALMYIGLKRKRVQDYSAEIMILEKC